MKEYIVLIVCLVKAVIAGNNFQHNPASSILQIREIDKYLNLLPESIRYPKLGRQLLMIRGLPAQDRQRPPSVDVRMGGLPPRTSKQNRKVGTGGNDPVRSRLRSTPVKTSRLRGADSERNVHNPSVAPPCPNHTKYKAHASVTAKGPATLSVSTYASNEELTKSTADKELKLVPPDVAATMKTAHYFAATAAGSTTDPSLPCNHRGSEGDLKAKAQGSVVYTRVAAPTGGRGHIEFKERGKMKEVVHVPGGETVEEHRSAVEGPMRTMAKVSRGGNLRVGGIYKEGNENP